MAHKFFELDSQYPLIKNKLNKALEKLFRHKQFIHGPEVLKLEAQLEKHFEGSHIQALAVNSGTSALICCLMALELKAGDEVISSPLTFGATALAIKFTGAVPVFVDIEKDTGLIKASSVEKAINSKTKAILPVSIYGQPADMDEINNLAKKHSLAVVEDACQSFGAVYKGKKSGALSDLSALSFFPAKPLGAYGSAGCVLTRKKKYANKIKSLRNNGQAGRFVYKYSGFNALMSSFQALVLLEKLKIFKKELKARQKLAINYDRAFQKMAPDIQIVSVKKDRSSARNYYVLRSKKRTQIMNSFKKAGWPLSIHYPRPLFDLPAFKSHCKLYGDPKGIRQFMKEIFSLPLYPYLKVSSQKKIIKQLKEVFKR